MKKSITNIALIFFVASCFMEVSGQIQLSPDDVYHKGEFQMTYDDTSAGMDPGTPGPNKVWDFRGLKGNGTFSFQLAGYNGKGNGNDANLVKINGTDTFDYIQKTGSDIFIVMPLQDFGKVIYKKLRIMSFPNSFNRLIKDSVTTVINHTGLEFGMPYYDSISLSFKMVSISEADAWGIIKLPTADFNSLRVKTETIITVRMTGKKGAQPFVAIPSQDQDEYTTRYLWFAKDKGHYIAAYDADLHEMEYMVYGQLSSNESLEKHADIIVSNPIDHGMMIRNNGSEACKVSLFDLNGKLVFSQSIEANSENVFETLEWPSGIYYLEIMNLQTQRVTYEKLVK